MAMIIVPLLLLPLALLGLYILYTVTDILHSNKELDFSFSDEYWIVDNATFTMDEY